VLDCHKHGRKEEGRGARPQEKAQLKMKGGGFHPGYTTGIEGGDDVLGRLREKKSGVGIRSKKPLLRGRLVKTIGGGGANVGWAIDSEKKAGKKEKGGTGFVCRQV